MEAWEVLRKLGVALGILLLAAAAPLRCEERRQDQGSADVAAARAVFEKNLQAIRDKNREAYLSCYLQSEGLARTGPEGFQLGYESLAATAGQGWPDHIAADDLHLTPVRPGLVYGTYRYRVRYGGREDSGLSERLFVQTPQGWKIAVSTAFSALPGVPPPPRALVGATLVDGTGAAPVRDAVVLLRDGKIECAGPRAACPVPAGVDSTDLAGLWITPGLVDAHVHFSQTGWADGRPDSLDVRERHPYEKVVAGLERHPERFGRSYLCSGVTAVFDVGGYAWTLGLPSWAEPNAEVPRIAAAGPLLSTIDHWLNLPAERQFMVLSDPDAARKGVDYLAERGAAAVKVWYVVTPDQTVEKSAAAVQAAGEAARGRKLPLIVHATGLAEAKEALKAGAKLLVHGVGDKPVDDELLDLARKNGTVYCPTLTVRRGYARMYAAAGGRQAPAVDDPNGCVDPETRARVAETPQAPSDDSAQDLETRDARLAQGERIAAANLKRVAEAGIPIAMGTDAGNPLTLHGPAVYAEMEAMQAAGLTPMQVLVAATRGGATAMGREKDLGTVEKGKLADLLIVAGDPTADAANFRKVRWVVRGGVVRSIAELHALATTAAE
ncbi:MAG TPA: amidohydrolase family protein [Thermoanaerobaculia bacterium]|nr:amidohydrolase family protein [Thermoanaerobaculia bacterium]